MLKLGYAEVDITPMSSVELVGFYRKDNRSRGILAPLLAQVSIWENEELCCCIVIDNIGFKVELANILREKVAEKLRVSRDKVMICFSHTHSAPNADENLDYFDMVCDKVLSAVDKAVDKMSFVSVGWENADVDIGVNRREGHIQVDKRAGILKVCETNTNKIKLILVRVTAHCNVLKRDNYLISPDYFGNIRKMLQEKNDCPVMVIQGAAGNIAPRYFSSIETPIDAIGSRYIRSKTALDDMAFAVCERIIPKIADIQLTDKVLMTMFSKNIVLNAYVPSLEEAEHILKEAYENCGIDGSAWLEEVKTLRTQGIIKQEESVEVQYFKIGNWCICGAPYELMVEFALDTKQKLNNEFFYVNGYTNGCSSYFPTEEEFDIGGYEVYWVMLVYFRYYCRVFPFERSSATKLVDFIVGNAIE